MKYRKAICARVYSLSIVLGLILLCGPLAAQTNTNRIANPGFETGEGGVPSGWSLNLNSWTGASGTIDWQTRVTHSGKYAVQLEKTNDKGRLTLVSAEIPLKPGVRYVFSGWMKTEFQPGAANPLGYFFLVGRKDGKDVKQLGHTPLVKSTTDWSEYTLATSFSDAYDAVSVHAVIGPGPGTVFVDDVSLTEWRPSTPAAVAGSLTRNSDFESSALAPNAPDHWRSSNPATATWSTEYACSGTRSVKIAGSGYWIQTGLPALPGRKLCKVSFNVITDKFGEKFKVYLEKARDGKAGSTVAGFTDRGEGMRTWHKKEFTFRAPTPDEADSFYIVLTVIDGTVWYDDVKVEIIDDGETPKDEARAMDIELLRPYWRNTIFASETLASVKGRVLFRQERRPAGRCVVEIRDAHDKPIAETTLPCAAGARSVDFEFVTDAIHVGEYRILAKFTAEGIDWSATCPLRRVGPSRGEIRVREDNVLLVNGKPFFPIGLWPVRNLPEAAAAGFNFVYGHNPDARIPSVFEAHQAKLEELGLKSFTELHIYTELERSAQKTADQIVRGARRIKDNPTFLGWLMDETVLAGIPPSYARTCHDALFQIDPYHLIWTSHAPRNSIKEIADWNRHMDLTWCNIYPYPGVLHSDLPNKTMSVVGDETMKQRRTVNDRKPVWMNLQGFIWENKPAPTWEATRFMAYDAILSGAKGVIWYHTHKIPQTSPFWSAIKRTAGELRDISAVLVSPDVQTELRIACENPDQVRYLLKTCGEDTYLLAENRSDKELAVRFDGVPARTGNLTVLFEDRSVSLQQGTLNDVFAPYAVHVYTDGATLPAPLAPTTPAARRFAEDERALQALIDQGWLSRTWNAEWIWHPDRLKTSHVIVYARKAFTLDGKPEHAWVQIAVDDNYVLHVNGETVHASGWGSGLRHRPLVARRPERGGRQGDQRRQLCGDSCARRHRIREEPPVARDGCDMESLPYTGPGVGYGIVRRLGLDVRVLHREAADEAVERRAALHRPLTPWGRTRQAFAAAPARMPARSGKWFCRNAIRCARPSGSGRTRNWSSTSTRISARTSNSRPCRIRRRFSSAPISGTGCM